MQPVLLSGSPILDIDATFVIYSVVFWILFFVLRAMVFKPAMELFDAREEAIDGAKRKAAALEQEAEEKLAAFEDEMAKVRREAGTERERLRADSQRRERKLIDRVRAETEGMVSDADEKMAREAAALRTQIKAAAPELARDIAEKLLGREVKA
ncbi:MAG: ATP synthase F0 subunit B [Sandaracinaceae bacterium]